MAKLQTCIVPLLLAVSTFSQMFYIQPCASSWKSFFLKRGHVFSLAMHFYCGTRWRRTTMNAPSISRLPLLIATRVFFFFCGLFPSVTLAPIFLFFCRAKKEEDSALFFHECLHHIFPLSLFPHLRSRLLHFFSQPKKSWERFPRPSCLLPR